MTFGELFSPTTDVIPDNKAAAVEIEGLDGNDYIKIDTTEGEEAVKLVSSGTGNAGIGSGFTTPQERLHIADPGSEGVRLKFTTGDTGHGDTDGSSIGLDSNGSFSIANLETDKSIFFQTEGLTRGGIWYDGRAEFRGSMNVANTSTPGTDGVAIGQSAQAGGTASVALGRLNNSSGAYGVTAGTGLTASGVKSSAFGVDCYAGHHSSLALGFKANTAFIQSLAMVGTPAVGGGGAQTMMCLGTVETTDASETYLDTSDGSEDLEIFSSPGLAKSQVIHIEATILSVCNSASGAYAADDFVSRKYNFAIQYTYNSAVAGFIGASNTGISSGGSMNGSREYLFTDDASGIGSASAGTGIDDKLYFVTSTNKVSVKLSVTGGEASATVRHVAHITAKTITMD
jgi:hypothetical protein